MSERRILTPDEWELVEPIVRGEFENGMPKTPEQATFLAEMDGGRVRSFVHVETLFHFVSVYAAPEERLRGLGFDLMRDAVSRVPAGFPSVWLTDRNAGALARKFGARDIGRWRVYRRDGNLRDGKQE